MKERVLITFVSLPFAFHLGFQDMLLVFMILAYFNSAEGKLNISNHFYVSVSFCLSIMFHIKYLSLNLSHSIQGYMRK